MHVFEFKLVTHFQISLAENFLSLNEDCWKPLSFEIFLTSLHSANHFTKARRHQELSLCRENAQGLLESLNLQSYL